MRRAFLLFGLAILALLGLGLLAGPAALRGWRALFLLVQAPFAGAVLMLAIGRVTGADWTRFAPLARAAWIVAPLAALIGLSTLWAGVPWVYAVGVTPLPDGIAWWQNGWMVALRGLVAGGLLGFAGRRLVAGASASFAAVALAVYVALATPIGFDWLLGADPGHTVSSAGMMLAVGQIGAACAVVLLLGWGEVRFRQDMAKLLAAAALGLSYLGFMDYLITWYGNLPTRIGYYAVRGTPAASALAAVALGIGLGGTIAALASGRMRLGGATALAGLALFDIWWVGGDWFDALLAVALAAAVALVLRNRRRRPAHG
jgi:hypothetical protein